MSEVGSRPVRRRPPRLPRPDPAATLSFLRADLAAAWALPLVRRGLLAMVLISAGSLTPAFLPLDQNGSSETVWVVQLLHVQWLQYGAGRFLATVVLSAGVILLLDTWLRLRPIAGGSTAPAVTWAIWALPVLLCPPLFSRDAYSYAAQGLVVQRGLDPYQNGPMLPGDYGYQVDQLWFQTPAPYGPLALQVQRVIVELTQNIPGDSAYAAAVAMRLPALASMALIAYALPRLAGRVGVNRQQAVWLGVLNPLAMLHIVGGMHNDAMMVALSVFALLLASRGHFLLGCLALGAAASFKQTAVMAIIGVVALGIRYRHGSVARRTYLVGLGAGSAVMLAGFEAITLATGLGWGWVPNLSVPASIRSLLSPPTLVGSIVEAIFYVLGLPRSVQLVPVALMQSIGLVTFAVIAVWLTFWVAPRRPVMASAMALIAFCLCGPVIHPWYLLWGGALLAATKMDRRTFKAAIYVSLFLCTYSMIDAAFSNDRSALVVSAVALVLWSVQGVWRPTPPGPAPGGLLGPKPWAVGTLHDVEPPLEPHRAAEQPEPTPTGPREFPGSGGPEPPPA